MNKSVLKRYAHLLITKGINVQKGQDVIIMADLDQPEFVKMCVIEAYKAGAALVKVEWNFPDINKITTNKASYKRLAEFTDIEKAKWQYKVDKMPCLLYIESSDPDALKGVNQEKSTKIRAEKFKFIKHYRDQIDNKYQWCIAAVPALNATTLGASRYFFRRISNSSTFGPRGTIQLSLNASSIHFCSVPPIWASDSNILSFSIV